MGETKKEDEDEEEGERREEEERTFFSAPQTFQLLSDHQDEGKVFSART